MAEADDDAWVPWEPPTWVAARGPSLCRESAHFCVRWGSTGPASERAAQAAPALLEWLEQCFAVFCHPSSRDFFVEPYTAMHWSNDGLPRKLNVYIGLTGLDPHPQQGSAWAHQGTWVEEPVEEVRHVVANPFGKLHHSYLALHPGAATAERTVCHELGHCLQMHTGGHLNTERVGYQWEAHAEYCVHLRKPDDPGWAPHVPVFLRTAHLPIDATNYDGEGEGAGRQYIVWPFYCWLDVRFGRRTVHQLWHADRTQRQRTGVSQDMISNLLAQLAGSGETLGSLFGAFAMASLTLDWGWTPAESAALLKAADPLDPLRFTPLRRMRSPPPDGKDGCWWLPDGSRGLKRCGFCAHRLEVPTTGESALAAAAGGELETTTEAQEVEVALRALPPTGPAGIACDLHVGIAGIHPSSCERHLPLKVAVVAHAEQGQSMATLRFRARPGFVYMLSVCAAPCDDADFAPLKWGVPPASLPTYRYAVALSGCSPHAGGGGAVPPQATDLPPLTVPTNGQPLHIPTGLSNLMPCPRLSGGGASLTAIDVRSGNPNEVNTVLLRAGRFAAKGRTVRHIRFSYRYVVGYSGNEGDPGPCFELQLVDGADMDGQDPAVVTGPFGGGDRSWAEQRCACCGQQRSDADGLTCPDCTDQSLLMEPTTHVLYRSPPAAARPYSWDAATGGHPTNYSPCIHVTEECAVALRGEVQALRLVFTNGKRNMHLQAGAWVAGSSREACVDLDLHLTID